MPFFAFSAILLLIAYPMVGSAAAVWVLACSQLVVLVRELRTGQVTGAGAFIFMSLLFFSGRPIYILIERDYRLLPACSTCERTLKSSPAPCGGQARPSGALPWGPFWRRASGRGISAVGGKPAETGACARRSGGTWRLPWSGFK